NGRCGKAPGLGRVACDVADQSCIQPRFSDDSKDLVRCKRGHQLPEILRGQEAGAYENGGSTAEPGKNRSCKERTGVPPQFDTNGRWSGLLNQGDIPSLKVGALRRRRTVIERTTDRRLRSASVEIWMAAVLSSIGPRK